MGDVRRQDRQTDEFGSTTGGGDFENCALVGFEFRRGQECNEVKEIECYPVNVTKKRLGELRLTNRCNTTPLSRFELREKCSSLIDKDCDVGNLQRTPKTSECVIFLSF